MRYARLLAVQLRISLATSMQYRLNFVVDGAVSILWSAIGLVPLLVAFHARPAVAGWSLDEALVVVAWFTMLKGLLDGAVSPSLMQVVDHIRKGTLDYVLLKPADAQFLVSTSRFELWKALDGLAGLALFGVAFSRLGRVPSAGSLGVAAVLLVCSVMVLYSVWILVVAAAFWVVRLDNLGYMFGAVFDFARWPTSIFRGVVRFVFTFVVPLAVLTTFPAEALLGRLAPTTAIASIAGSILFTAVARAVWKFAIRRYTSASS